MLRFCNWTGNPGCRRINHVEVDGISIWLVEVGMVYVGVGDSSLGIGSWSLGYSVAVERNGLMLGLFGRKSAKLDEEAGC